MAWISFRVSEDEKREIKKIAKELGISISDYARLKVFSKASIRRRKTNCKEYEQLLKEINKIGRNINQIAKYCNQNRDVDVAVLEALSNIEGELLRIADQLPDPDCFPSSNSRHHQAQEEQER